MYIQLWVSYAIPTSMIIFKFFKPNHWDILKITVLYQGQMPHVFGAVELAYVTILLQKLDIEPSLL